MRFPWIQAGEITQGQTICSSTTNQWHTRSSGPKNITIKWLVEGGSGVLSVESFLIFYIPGDPLLLVIENNPCSAQKNEKKEEEENSTWIAFGHCWTGCSVPSHGLKINSSTIAFKLLFWFLYWRQIYCQGNIHIFLIPYPAFIKCFMTALMWAKSSFRVNYIKTIFVFWYNVYTMTCVKVVWYECRV